MEKERSAKAKTRRDRAVIGANARVSRAELGSYKNKGKK